MICYGMTGTSAGTKRLRLSLTEQRTDALQVIERKSPVASNDLIEYFAERGDRALKLQREKAECQGELSRLQTSLRTADQEIISLKARPVQEFQLQYHCQEDPVKKVGVTLRFVLQALEICS